jgi:mono/diheme cytochrome c family protein
MRNLMPEIKRLLSILDLHNLSRFVRATPALVLWALPLSAAQNPPPDAFAQTIAPFVQKNCALCHNEQTKSGGLVLTKYHDTASLVHDRDVWEKVVIRLRAGEMPPKGMPRPAAEQLAEVTNWIDAQFAEIDRTSKPDPGHLTAHRLNRVEYNNTIRDLLAVKFKPAADFPADDSGYGFDNIGDALSVSPVLMEKYLAAAKKIATEAIPLSLITPKPTRLRYSPEHLAKEPRPELEHSFDLPSEGDYDLRASVGGRQDSFVVQLLLDGKEIKTDSVLIQQDKPRGYEVRLHLLPGEHSLQAVLTHRDPTPEESKLAAKMKADEEAGIAKQIAKHPEDEKQIRLQHALGDTPTYMDSLEIKGPFNALPVPLPESYKRIFLCGHPIGQHNKECVRSNLAQFASLAYRRPATSAEVSKLTKLVSLGEKDGLNFEQSMRLGVEAVLVSPQFLYRLEHDPKGDPGAVHPIGDYELASRLSYFLWSSMPDAQLLQLAAEKRLTGSEVLHAQVRRMLLDPKAAALIDNFAGQWLELRNLDSIHPDPVQFPEFDNQLRQAMYTETRMFFASVVEEDRSILDFIDAKYTFVNERLAKFYGIQGVEGNQFRRVELDGTQRSGVLTQASVLAITSYPTRTSPVLRGKWIMENVLNTPPPPPPPGVGSLDEKGGPLSGTMRQQMERHRANPVCAGCHVRMDPLGFALENYDAVGHWRTEDASLPIDSTGVLPNGKKFTGSAELKAILAANRNAFAECLSEKMMIYALGRGLEVYDRAATRKIVANLAAHDYRFSTLIEGIIESAPFQLGRADEGNKTE